MALYQELLLVAQTAAIGGTCNPSTMSARAPVTDGDIWALCKRVRVCSPFLEKGSIYVHVRVLLPFASTSAMPLFV